jgi:ribosomal protein L37E
MIIFGFRRRVRLVATLRARCSRCGQDAAQRLIRSQHWFTLFFLPIFPFKTVYVGTCTACGFAQKVTREMAKTLEGGPPAAAAPAPTATGSSVPGSAPQAL